MRKDNFQAERETSSRGRTFKLRKTETFQPERESKNWTLNNFQAEKERKRLFKLERDRGKVGLFNLRERGSIGL